MTQQPARIVILGGGFGGLYTALRLNELPWGGTPPEIVLVDQRDRFLFSPLLYELLTGELQTWEIAPPFGELLADTRVRFVQSAVSSIDLEAKRVQLDGMELEFDRLVLAMGGEAPLEIVPGATEYAIPFRTLEDAYRLQERLRTLEQSDKDKIRVAIVGAGYSGVELACKLADRLGDTVPQARDRGRFRLIEKSDQILATSLDFNREAAKQALDDRGVWIDLETEVESIGADTISLSYKGQIDPIPVDLVLWTIGTKVAAVVQDLPLKRNQRGQIVVTPTLQAVDAPDIFALGDLAECLDAEGQRVPGTAQAAFQQAEYCGWNVWASLSERPLLPFRYQALGELMTLGTEDATFSGMGIKLDGQLAYIARRLAYLYRMPTIDHQLKVGLNWIAQPIRDLLTS